MEHRGEVELYDEALESANALLEAGNPDEALAVLNELRPPETDEGREIWPLIVGMRRLCRAASLMSEGAMDDGMREWDAALDELPDGPIFDAIRESVAAMGLVFKHRGDLGAEQFDQLPEEQKQWVLQMRVLEQRAHAMKEARGALAVGDEATYAERVNRASRLMTQAAAENPRSGPTLTLIAGMDQLLLEVQRQQRELDRFNFNGVVTIAKEIEGAAESLSSSVADLRDDASVPIEWISQLAEQASTVGSLTTMLGGLIQAAISHARQGTGLSQLDAFADDTETVMSGLTALDLPGLASDQRSYLVATVTRLGDQARRLASIARPSRSTVVSSSGLAALVGFVVVVAALLAVGKATGEDLDGWLVLLLSAFFGLVAGFGYGAIRFRGFLTDLVGGGRASGSADK